jgi:hypothetical protein
MSDDSETSAPLTGLTSSQLTLFAEAFPVNRTRPLVDDWEPKTTAISGASLPESFANLDPDGLWRKTFQDCCQPNLDGSLAEYSETWPRAGMTQSGTAYLLSPLAPLIDAIGSGLWPTPCAQEDNKSPEAHLAMKTRMKGGPRQTITSLNVMVKAIDREMWPTPQATDSFRSRLDPETLVSTYERARHRQRGAPSDLGTQVLWRGLWSSPTVRDAGTLANVRRGHGSSDKGNEWIQPLPVQVGGTLNPMWVEWLMGYPLGWTDCADSVMPSSRRSPNGSGGASSKRKRKT